MTRFVFIVSLMLGFSLPVCAQLFRVPAASIKLAKTGAEMTSFPRIMPELTKRIFAASRSRFAGPRELMARVPKGLIQVARPESPTVLGTGFLFESHGQLWAAMPYHIGGAAGQKRVARVWTKNGLKEYTVTVAVSGSAGWSSPDVSLAPLPKSALEKGAEPFSLGIVRTNVPSYSFGYVAGPYGRRDFLPVRRDIINAAGFGVIGKREIKQDDVRTPFLLSGYCGSPVFQKQGDNWQVVALHSGGCAMPGSRAQSHTYAVNLSQAVPMMLDQYFQAEKLPARPLVFRGWEIGRLLLEERVKSVAVWRGEKAVFTLDLRNYPQPYEDAHAELAFAEFDLQSGDVLRFTVLNEKRKLRVMEFTLP